MEQSDHAKPDKAFSFIKGDGKIVYLHLNKGQSPKFVFLRGIYDNALASLPEGYVDAARPQMGVAADKIVLAPLSRYHAGPQASR